MQVASITTADERLAGTATQLAKDVWITCAHVVNIALGNDYYAPELPDDPVLLNGKHFYVHKKGWWIENLPGPDLAILVQNPQARLRFNKTAVQLARPRPGHGARIQGYKADDNGRPTELPRFVPVTIEGTVDDPFLHLYMPTGLTGEELDGMSGGPVLARADSMEVQGIAVLQGGPDIYMISSCNLKQITSEVLSLPVGRERHARLTRPLRERLSRFEESIPYRTCGWVAMASIAFAVGLCLGLSGSGKGTASLAWLIPSLLIATYCIFRASQDEACRETSSTLRRHLEDHGFMVWSPGQGRRVPLKLWKKVRSGRCRGIRSVVAYGLREAWGAMRHTSALDERQ